MNKLLLCLCIMFTINTHAQTIDKKWNIGLHGGISQYKGDLGNDFYRTDMAFYGLGGFSVSRYLFEHFDLNLLAVKGTVGFKDTSGEFRRDITSINLNFRFNILGPQYCVRPYLFVGGGAMLFDKNLDISEKKIDYIAPSFGAGINFRVNPSVMINLQENFLYSTADNRDFAVGDENDAYLFHMVGVTFNFGQKKDEDGDGISDHYDKCATTPEGVSVDKNGCPLDVDNDKVADYIDACPTEFGIVFLEGCPDKDDDGIADKNDNCPDEKGSVLLIGCPDKDGDGIADMNDRCPDLPGNTSMQGCPDSDNDGVANIDDKCSDTEAKYHVDSKGCPMDNDHDGLVNEDDACPEIAGILSLKGCADGDADGVADNLDRCPTIKGNIANKGCPEITAVDVKRITEISSKIFFETNSDKLKTESLVQLDELVLLLKKYESANLFIEGFTDSQGDDAFNLELSQKRTEAVKSYLMSKGIFESRLIATGHGESEPIADNNTSVGRSKNRRVELKTSY